LTGLIIHRSVTYVLNLNCYPCPEPGPFELEMLQRSARKVTDSAAAAQYLHSDIVLHEGDEPRGRCLRRNENLGAS
ncbi:MAG: hypothetical protein MJH11_19830, partial [Lentisphaeria bacterium]|nr:hypothetical protein [Lentisphaeria bacterium]